MAKKLGIVHCRVCNGEIDRNTTEEGKDWLMRSKGWFYHKDCYDSWVAEKDNLHASKGNEEWLDYTWEFLTKEMLMEIDFIKFKKQWESYLKKNMTAKGIYFSLRYYYDIQKAPRNKAKGGIGIVPYVYDEACSYWVERERKEKGICERITQQLRLRAEAERKRGVKPQTKQATKKKKKHSLDMIEMEAEN